MLNSKKIENVVYAVLSFYLFYIYFYTYLIKTSYIELYFKFKAIVRKSKTR